MARSASASTVRSSRYSRMTEQVTSIERTTTTRRSQERRRQVHRPARQEAEAARGHHRRVHRLRRRAGVPALLPGRRLHAAGAGGGRCRHGRIWVDPLKCVGCKKCVTPRAGGHVPRWLPVGRHRHGANVANGRQSMASSRTEAAAKQLVRRVHVRHSSTGPSSATTTSTRCATAPSRSPATSSCISIRSPFRATR